MFPLYFQSVLCESTLPFTPHSHQIDSRNVMHLRFIDFFSSVSLFLFQSCITFTLYVVFSLFIRHLHFTLITQ